MEIAVLGAGMVGRAIAIDLAKNYEVTSFDISDHSLQLLSKANAEIHVLQADLTNIENYNTWFEKFDVIVSAVPGSMGYRALQSIIECGKNVVDISFFPENALELDTLAKKNGVTAIVDCGVAPGMSNLILGYYDTQMQVEEFECMVGGLPKLRTKPFEYKAPFSPADVIEEYIRPARYVENKHIITKPALSDAELIDFEKAGTLECFNTDGLRSLLYTMAHIPNMKEKTLRYPGHIDLIISLFKAGFFEKNEITIAGNKIRPVDFTSALLFDKWKLTEDEEEFTIMKIVIRGLMNNKRSVIEYNLYDEYDRSTRTASMSRTTGYTCNAAVNLIVEKIFEEKGVFPPELIGRQKLCFDFVVNYLKQRNVNYNVSVS